jgi:hypothetical protein
MALANGLDLCRAVPLDHLDSSTGGMPVPRHRPCSPGRAVCPYTIPRWSSRPRCQAALSSKHSLIFDLRHAGLRSPGPPELTGR